MRAESQAAFLDAVREQLTEDEQDVMRRGRNATKTSVPKHADSRSYRMATALEALFGYLYLTGQNDRLYELFGRMKEMMPVGDLLGPEQQSADI